MNCFSLSVFEENVEIVHIVQQFVILQKVLLQNVAYYFILGTK